MIRFADKLDKTESAELPEQSGFKEIKPILKTSESQVKDYWDDIFSEDNAVEDMCFTDDEIISAIFERSESDFKFDIDANDEVIQEKLTEFDFEKWNKFDETQKLEVIDDFISVLCEKMGVEEQPRLFLFEDDENFCGAYNNQSNTLELNRNILDNPKEVVNTIAHETRHAYQYQRACIGETREDMLYAINFLNYIEPIQIDGYYVNFNEYQNQLIEAEARAFAKVFSN